MTSTREHILLTGLKLFLQKTYKEVTMKDLVTHSGLSKGAFYHYFESKEQLFHEIIDFFFSNILSYDFDVLPKDSLRDFYKSYTEQMNSLRFSFLSIGETEQQDFISMNFFALLFDAFKLFPEFKTKMEAYHLKETEAWLLRTRNARYSGEITTPLDDRQVVQIFMYTSDGLTMNLTMDQDTTNLDKKLLSLWDNFYATIKT